MIRSIAQISKLLITTGKSRSAVQLFVSDISEEHEKKLGKLFGIIEIDTRDRENPAVIEALIEAAEEFYYGPRERRMPKNSARSNEAIQLSLSDAENIEVHLEKALQKLNLKITTLMREEAPNLLPEKINAIIGVMKDRSLFFTHLGRVQAYLIHKKKTDDYSVVDVIEQSGNTSQPINIIRIFSNIVSGIIGPEDIVFFSTTSLFDYFSLEHLKNTLTSLTLPSALHQFKTRLEDAGSSLNFAALFLKLVGQREHHIAMSEEGLASSSSQASMTELSLTHEKTREYLTPSLFKTLQKKIQGISQATSAKSTELKQRLSEWQEHKATVKEEKIQEKNRLLAEEQLRIAEVPTMSELPKKKRSQKPETLAMERASAQKSKKEILEEVFAPLPTDRATITKNPRGAKLKQLWNQCSHLIITNGSAFLRSLTNKNTWSRFSLLLKNVFHFFKKNIAGLKHRFMLLSKKSKILLCIVLLMIGLLSVSLWRMSREKNQEIEVATWNAQVEDVRKKINAAEASIIYNDETKGRTLLAEAEHLLSLMNTGLDTRREARERLQSEVTALLQKMRRVEYISDPLALFDFSTVTGAGKVDGLTLQNNTLYAWNPETNVIYKLNTAADTYEARSIEGHSAEFGGLKKGIVKNEQSILFLEGKNDLFELNTRDNVFQKKSVLLQNTDPFADITIFNNRLYTLTEKGTVLRHDAALSGYGRGSEWIKDGTNLSGARSLAIDGEMYILKNTGEIVKLLNGKNQGFSVGNIDPAWGSPTELFTSSQHRFIYVLDPAEKRLVVFDKNGKLITQYTSEAFTDLRGFAISSDEKRLFLLSGNIVYGVLMNHAK